MTDCMASLLIPHLALRKIRGKSPVEGEVNYSVIIYLLRAEAHLIALCAIISPVFCEESSCNNLYEVSSPYVFLYEVIILYMINYQ